MSSTRYLRVALCALSISAALAAAPVIEAAEIQSIRHSSTAKRTRVVLDIDASTAYRHRTLSDPPRILIALEASAFADGVRERSVGDGYLNNIRLNALARGRVQVVLDLSRSAEYDSFLLEAPARIVVDIYHDGRPVPPPAASTPSPEPPATGETPAETKPAEIKPSEPEPSESKPAAPKPAEPKPAVSKAADDPANQGGAGSTPSAGGESSAKAPSVSVERVVTPVRPPERDQPWKVAVDAGHGGDDHGCRYHRTSEKDVVLSLARELVTSLNDRDGIEAFLTRKGNYFIPLRRRRQMAEEASADLFVSLHCNASKNLDARGTEVYFLSLDGASDEAAKELATRENAVDEQMGVAPGHGEVGDILFDMMQTDVVAKSELLAEFCLESLFGLGTVYNRGVKQAGFAVLKSPTVPSVLVEAAFLSNKEENRLLRDPAWQRQFGKLMADGISIYCRSLEGAASGTQRTAR